jgi:hypothetical protein
MSEDIIILEPTIIRKRALAEDLDYIMSVPSENALVVFRSEDEAEKFRSMSGLHPASEGFEAVRVDERDIGRICVKAGLSSVAMPEPWTGAAGVDFFDAAEFIGMLRESLE